MSNYARQPLPTKSSADEEMLKEFATAGSRSALTTKNLGNAVATPRFVSLDDVHRRAPEYAEIDIDAITRLNRYRPSTHAGGDDVTGAQTVA